MTRVSILAALLLLGLQACSKPSEEVPLPAEPAPIRVVDDPSPSAVQPVTPTASLGSDEFECAADATEEAGLKLLEQADRPDDSGRVASVSTFDGTGLTVFGLPALYVERHDRDRVRVGVGVYVRATASDARQKILARFPQAQASGDGFIGGGLRNPIALQDAEQGLLFIRCVAP